MTAHAEVRAARLGGSVRRITPVHFRLWNCEEEKAEHLIA